MGKGALPGKHGLVMRWNRLETKLVKGVSRTDIKQVWMQGGRSVNLEIRMDKEGRTVGTTSCSMITSSVDRAAP